VPSSISFDSTGTIVTIAPQMPLPASTQITIAINGVTDPEATRSLRKPRTSPLAPAGYCSAAFQPD